jgi:plastocyanin
VLAWALAAAAPPSPKTVEITINQLAFGPAEAHATVGDTIEWVNRDPIVHTATARNGAWKVVVQPGKKASTTLTRVGTFEYYCEYHPNMTAVIVVEKSAR